MSPRASEHIREVETVLLGGASSRDPVVLSSWQRCVETHRLDPSRPCEAYILPETRLREHRERSEKLIRTARSGLETLQRQMAGQGYVLLLSDEKGVTVDFIGDPTFDNQLRKAGLYLGSEWSESRAGTCAVGASIATGEALTIHRSDHFDLTHTPLTCSAASRRDRRHAADAPVPPPARPVGARGGAGRRLGAGGRQTSASSPRRIRISAAWCKRAASAKTSTAASMPRRCACRRCDGAATSNG